MRQETVTYDVFKFNELDESTQKKVLEKFRDFNVEHDWYEFTIDDFTEKLNSMGFNDVVIGFSGFWSPGDGASFTVKSCDIEKLVEALKERSNNYSTFKKYLPKISEHIALSTRTVNHHYSHERTKVMDLDCSLPSNCKRLNKLVDTFLAEVEELRLDLCREIYRVLEQEYYYLTSDDVVRESIDANEFEFLKDGTIYR